MITVFVLLLLQAMYIDPVYVLFFIALLVAFIILFGISPLFTDHWVTLSRLILRQGIYFKASIPYDNIRSVDETDEMAKVGVKFYLFGRKVFVTTSRNGLVSIKLKRPMRFTLILGKLADEVIVNVDNPREFVSSLKERIALFPPVQSDSSDAHLRYQR